MVMSGFLGAGKTTVMMALTNYMERTGCPAAMISNDLGRKGLADYRYSKAAGVRSCEIAGECICFVTEELIEKLRRLYSDDGCRMVMSDIPGFGVGALEHVYYKLRDLYPDECGLAPFTVIVDGNLLCRLVKGGRTTALPEEMTYLLKSQLLEGDLIVLNKTDLYTDEERAAYLKVLRGICPCTPVISVSAVTGEGIPELADYLLNHETGFPEPDFGVTEEEFESAFGRLSIYNCQYYAVVCCDDFDANHYLTDLAEEIRGKLMERGYDTPHLKLFAEREDGDYSKVDLLGVDRDVIMTHAMTGRCTDLPVIINTTSAADAAYLTEVIDGVIAEISGKYNLSVTVFYKESFGLNDEGRL